MVKGVKTEGKELLASMYECAICQDRFWMGTKFVQHMLEDHNVVAESYNCKMCPASYWKKLMLEDHVNIVHNNIPPKTNYPIIPGESIRQRLQRIVKSHPAEDTSEEENASLADEYYGDEAISEEENASLLVDESYIVEDIFEEENVSIFVDESYVIEVEDVSAKENVSSLADACHGVDDQRQEPIIIHCRAVNGITDEKNFSEDAESDTTNNRSSERLVKTRSGRVTKTLVTKRRRHFNVKILD